MVRERVYVDNGLFAVVYVDPLRVKGKRVSWIFRWGKGQRYREGEPLGYACLKTMQADRLPAVDQGYKRILS